MSSAWSLFLLVILLEDCHGSRLLNDKVRLPFVQKPPPGAPVDPEVYMNASELITSKGYPCERRFVKTEDGYILGVQRIPHGKNRDSHNGTKPVVLLQHALLASSTSFLENLANESFAYILADAGMDVWLGNSRGNTYSRRHTHLTPDQDAFWEWSWDEMAEFDLPAIIDHILMETGQDQLYYIGHSQGGGIGLAAFSENQQLAKKIKMFFALAPAAYLGHLKSSLKLLIPFADSIEFLWELFGHGQFFEKTILSDLVAAEVCDAGVGNLLCENILFLISGFDPEQTNATRIPVYLGHLPAGTSVRNVIHFVQAIKSKKFQKFDFGSADANIEHYNQTTPPEYNVREMLVPTAVFAGSEDWLTVPEDVDSLALKLPNLILNRVIDGWNHIDFAIAMNAPSTLYSDIINMIKNAERS